jgi:hypothetical protein
VASAFRVLGIGLFGEGGLVLHGHAQVLGKGLHGLMAADPVGRIHLRGAEGEELWDQRLGLRAAPFVQRPLGVIAVKTRFATGRAVPDHQHGLRVGGLFVEVAQHFSVLHVVELLHRLGERQP